MKTDLVKMGGLRDENKFGGKHTSEHRLWKGEQEGIRNTKKELSEYMSRSHDVAAHIWRQ